MIKKTVKKTIPLVVTTQHRGVFFGYGLQTTKKIIRIEKARMAVSWTSDLKGIMGLADIGPSRSCRVSMAIPAITLQDVTSIMEASPEAAKAWEKSPWS